MALNKNFYDEIYEKEKSWIEWINKDLINVYYITLLEEFYLEKQKALKIEFEKANNQIIGSFLNEINNILYQIKKIKENNSKEAIKKLPEYFLVSKLNNDIEKDEIDQNKLVSKEKLEKLKNLLIENYTNDDEISNQKVA